MLVVGIPSLCVRTREVGVDEAVASGSAPGMSFP